MDIENESILDSVKKLLGIAPDYNHFDADITMHINSVFMLLCQFGVGPERPFYITGNSEIWSDFCDMEDYNAVKSYIYLKVRMLFDTPTGSVLDMSKEVINELEWRLTNNKDILDAGGNNE